MIAAGRNWLGNCSPEGRYASKAAVPSVATEGREGAYATFGYGEIDCIPRSV